MTDPSSSTDPRVAPAHRWLLFLGLIALVIAFAGRILGPSDLLQNVDQSKTMALTADVVANARWALPRDAEGAITHKPPLVNWVAAVPVSLGLWTEWAFKLPSLLGALATIAATIAAARFLLTRPGTSLNQSAGRLPPAMLAVLAGMLWLASPTAIKHLYFCRPDMLFTACLAWGWYAAMRTLHDPQSNPKRWSLLLWICTGLALLTKGPLALLIPLYALLAPLLIERRPALLKRAGLLWGLPLALAILALWIVPAWLSDQAYVEDTLIGYELLSRIGFAADHAHTPAGTEIREDVPPYFIDILTRAPQIPSWFVERFLVWAPFALLGLALSPPWRWRSSPLAPAALWLLLVFISTMLIRNRGGSYLMPAYPAGAVLALAVLLHRRSPIPPLPIALTALVVTCLIVGREAFFSRAARTHAGDHAWAFARAARMTVGDDPVVFSGTLHNPVPMMMGRARLGEPTPEQVRAADWVIRPVPPGSDPDRPEPVLVSEELLLLRTTGQARGAPTRLGLYPAQPPR